MGKYGIDKKHYEYGSLSTEYMVPENTAEQQKEKETDMVRILHKIAEGTIRAKSYKDMTETDSSTKAMAMLESLPEDGVFADLPIVFENGATGLGRLTYIVAELFHHHIHKKSLADVPTKVKTGLIKYMRAELDHEDKGPSRFHTACFMVPTCAMNLFLSLLPDMLAIESEENTNELDSQLYTTICDTMMQAWYLPLRGDETDEHVVTVPRFRQHVWWEGGNGLTYRPVYYVAVCLRDVAMMDLLMYVALEASRSRSAFTEKSFWAEGVCSDGWGWGHGNQTYNNGYPIGSVKSTITMMTDVKGTAWEYMLPMFDYGNFLSLVRGLTWNINKTFFPPTMSRHCFYAPVSANTKSSAYSTQTATEIAKTLYDDFCPYMPDEMVTELKRLIDCSYDDMGEFSENYMGSRYFYNNDCLVTKNDNRFYLISMASSRLKGAECADYMADTRNFFLKDGLHFIQRTDDTYKEVMGTWNMTHLPGVTSRHLEKENLMSEVNWSGYNSKHNYAVGVACEDDAVCGFIFEKDDKRHRDGAGDARRKYTKEMMGVLAYKSTFVHGDTIVCLGCGITDNKAEYGNDIITTVNNVLSDGTRIYGEDNDFAGNTVSEENIYLTNGGVMYGVLASAQGKATLSVENRATDWVYLNACNKDEHNSIVPVMELGINHGKAPQNATYSYWAYCNTDKTPTEIEASFDILQNTKKAQAVSFAGDNLHQVIFYVKSLVETDTLYMEVSAPCAVMLKKIADSEYSIYVCDALQDTTLNEITITFQTADMAEKTTVTMDLPQKERRGSQASANIKV